MKKIFLLLSLSLTYLFLQAQNTQPDSWKIKWNKKVILETSISDETANIRKIKATDLKKKYFLEISYNPSDPKKAKAWNRSFMFFDVGDNEVLRKDSTHSAKVTAAELKKLFADKKTIKIYTIAVPNDPNLAARVRVRRVYLCTLVLQ